MQKQNPLLAMEALFRVQSKYIKDAFLSNYAVDQGYGLIDKQIQENNDDIEENIVF